VNRDNVNDVMTLHCEVAAGNAALQQAIQASLRDICKLRGEVQFVAVGSLPNDGKVIEDIRKYD
jgi:phenylacetate-CoA ligase